jgi:predicted negative regulator of RcsB-dependent stress response
MDLKKLIIGVVVLGGAYLAYNYVKNKNVTKIKEGSFTIEVQNDDKPNT